jgi:hypothetical protein
MAQGAGGGRIMIERVTALLEALTASDLEKARPTDLERSVPALGKPRGPEPRRRPRSAGITVLRVRRRRLIRSAPPLIPNLVEQVLLDILPGVLLGFEPARHPTTA